MKTANISVSINTSKERKTYTGRGAVIFPFVVHRPILSHDEMIMGGSHWCVSHMASGRQAFRAKTLKDVRRMISILSGFNLFLMPEGDKFYELCQHKGQEVKNALLNGGFSFDTMRFDNV